MNIKISSILFLSCWMNFCFGMYPQTSENKQAIDGENQVEIRLKINGEKEGTVFLIGVYTDQNFKMDSIQMNANGEASFVKKELYKAGYVYVLLPGGTSFPLLLDKDQIFELSADLKDLIQTMNITGSVDNQLLYENAQYETKHQEKVKILAHQKDKLDPNDEAINGLQAKIDSLILERMNTLTSIFNKYPDNLYVSFKSSGQNPIITYPKTQNGDLDTALQTFLYRTQFWDNVNFSDERLLNTPVIANKLKVYMTQLTAQYPDSINASADLLINKVLDFPEYYRYFVNWITLKYEPTKSTLMDPESVYVHMITNYFTEERAVWSSKYEVDYLQKKASEMSASLVGKIGPNVEAKDIHGNLKSIAQIKAPYVIVFMFSPDCDHCIQETPKMVEFYKNAKAEGVEVFGIALDTNPEEWKAFVLKNGMDIFPNVYDPTNKAIYKKYYVDITPEIYVLNPERIIIGKNLNVDQIDRIIKADREKR